MDYLTIFCTLLLNNNVKIQVCIVIHFHILGFLILNSNSHSNYILNPSHLTDYLWEYGYRENISRGDL